MFSMKLFVLLVSTLIIVNTMASEEVPVLGGVKPVSDLKTVEQELNESLSKLAAGDGPNYKLGKVYSATKQTVAGSLTKIVADIIDSEGTTKKGNVTIWSRPWLPNGIEVTFEFEGETPLKRTHSA